MHIRTTMFYVEIYICISEAVHDTPAESALDSINRTGQNKSFLSLGLI